VLMLIPAAFYIGDDNLRLNKAWVNILLWLGLVFISMPVKLTQALFQLTGQPLLLSLHFVGGILLYLILCLTWVTVYRKSNQQESSDWSIQ